MKRPSVPSLACALLLAVVLGNATAEQGQALLYVGNNHGGTISVNEVPGFEVVGEFDAAPDVAERDEISSFVDDVVVSSTGDVLYASRGMLRDVAAFSTATEELLWSLSVGGISDHFALSKDDRYLFVSVFSEDYGVVIDTCTREIIERIPTGPGPHGMVVSRNGHRVYNGCIGCDQLTIADARTFEPVGTIQFEDGVRPFVVNDDETKAYVQITKLHGFHELDLRSRRVTKTIWLPVPDGVTAQQHYPHTAQHGMALTPDGRHLCAAGTVADYVAILSVPELDLLATIPVGSEPSWVIPSLDGEYCYVSARKDDSVSIISVTERREIKRIAVGEYPQRMWTARVPDRRVATSP